jgi:hypothetical protein
MIYIIESCDRALKKHSVRMTTRVRHELNAVRAQSKRNAQPMQIRQRAELLILLVEKNASVRF